MAEIWKKVIGHEGYEVSDLGNVRSYRVPGRGTALGNVPHTVTQFPKYVNGRTAVMTVTLDRRRRKIHHLVLEAFVGPRPEGCECCHYDGDASNNRLDNLRWDTHQANSRDSIRQGRAKGQRGETHPRARLNEDDIRCIRAEPDFWGVNKMLANAFGVSNVAISRIRSRQAWAHIQDGP